MEEKIKLLYTSMENNVIALVLEQYTFLTCVAVAVVLAFVPVLAFE